MKTLRAALALQTAVPGRTDGNLDRCLTLAARAGDQGADVILFPELNLTGYTTSRRDLVQLAEPVPGRITQSLSALAVRKSIAILAGMAERDHAGNVFASHLAAMADGALHCYRKIHIPPPEQPLFTPGSEVTVFDLPGLEATFAMELCFDAHFPELSRALALQGADILFIPHASPRGTPTEKYRSWMRHFSARAFDNGLFVLACNQTGDNQNGLTFPGVAVALGPDGRVIKKQLQNGEGLVMATLEGEALNEVRNHRMKYFLPHGRKDLFP
ncbi:MAG TPA: nitrilase-related carbon-nitrogen hydrolase [Desulfobacteraceae bacterium]|nr:nitrilase-related carbon-nitrogen hydrolase [Desulfobacteraceae bacterium]